MDSAGGSLRIMERQEGIVAKSQLDQESYTIDGYALTVFPDVTDFRDYVYEPPLIPIREKVEPAYRPKILDQGSEGACTGFALAAVINYLNRGRGKLHHVSPRMLYEMARYYDRWPGEEYEGATCRGAIKGWYAMGACRDSDWRYIEGSPGSLTLARAKGARENRVGAYYRLNHRLSDFHAALTETGAIFVSANVHDGWSGGNLRTVEQGAGKRRVIPYEAGPSRARGHAFAIIGYDDEGFIVQNSWGESWGDRGVAVWTYEDWFANVRDAWAFRLSLSSPAIWKVSTRAKPRTGAGAETGEASPPSRGEIAGHFVHIDDGRFHDHGTYWSDLNDVAITSRKVAESADYDHLLFYAHGGLNSPRASARRIQHLAPVFKANRVYSYHFMYDTGLAEELKDVIKRKLGLAEERVGGVSDWTDKFIETVTRAPGRAIWREMKRGARTAFEADGAGRQTVERFAADLAGAAHPKQIHLLGHSTGAILLAHLLNVLASAAPGLRIASVSLLAPAASIDLYRSHYHPLLEAGPAEPGIDAMTVYNLGDDLERDDQVAAVYRKSLLYLVSRAFEEQKPEKLLGMQRYSVALDRSVGKLVEFLYSKGAAADRTAATTHGGFDNDPATLNDTLERVLGQVPGAPFRDEDLAYGLSVPASRA